MQVSSSSPYSLFECPHCQAMIEVRAQDINCGIFRHAVFKCNLEPIPAHSSEQACQQLLATNQIYGCGKPFHWKEGVLPSKCDYI